MDKTEINEHAKAAAELIVRGLENQAEWSGPVLTLIYKIEKLSREQESNKK